MHTGGVGGINTTLQNQIGASLGVLEATVDMLPKEYLPR